MKIKNLCLPASASEPHKHEKWAADPNVEKNPKR